MSYIFTCLGQFAYDWQTLITGILALVAAAATIWATRHAARQQCTATDRQTDTLKQQIASLEQQRDEEIVNIRDAVRIEVTVFVKYVIGAVELCEQIAKGTVIIPRQDARYIVKNFWGDPVIYPAIADRVGLLPQPHATTQFYMRLSEVKGMIEALRTKTDAPSITYNTAIEYVPKDFAEKVADSLITALQLARSIVVNDGDPSTKSQLETWVQAEMARQIDDCLKSAKATFPKAESFIEPHGG